MRRPVFSRRGVLAGGLAIAVQGPAVLLAEDAPVSIAVGSDPAFSAFYLAAHEKMFQAANLNVAVRIYGNGGLLLDAFVAQQVTLAVSTDASHIIRFPRAEMRPLAVVYQSGRYIKMVIGKGVESPDKIKTFGIVAGTVGEYCTRLALEKIGLNVSAVQMVKSGPPELPALLARGDIDAFFAWEPWPARGVEQGGRIVMLSRDVGYIDTMWITATPDWLAANTETAQRILKVVADACEIVVKDPERTAAAVQALTKIPVAQTLASLKDFDPGVRDFTDADFKSYDGIAAFLAQQKMTPGVVDVRRYIQRGFYKA